ncbi:radical SAM/SPASM domain-containing protein [uncultured Bacteroides sp.]|uniref:radical SAM/SPASM domain-containing protein n=1 Tax=uncultured Bacteroides sp. TaxID=162156 RepID=UPI002AAB24DC|nr:radical SAM protein [uncultured Bacteroides sp.]
MKNSEYNFILELNNKWYIYNSMSNKFAWISKSVSTFLRSNEIDKIDRIGLNILHENHFIIPNDVDEAKEVVDFYKKSVSQDIYSLTILPTLDCNVSCWYCFEKCVKNSRLSDFTSTSILNHLNLIIQTKPQIKKFQIELFGGEPLLYFKDNLYPLLEQMKYLADSNEKDISFLFITNGLCLNEKVIRLLKPFKPNFQISIDGYKKKHDSIKKIVGQEDKSAYDIVMKNIHLLISLLESHVTLRINYDDNTLLHINEVLESLKNIPRNKLSIHLERVWQTKGKKIEPNSKLKENIKKIIDHGFYVTYMNFFKKGFSCKTSKINHAAISYNGDVYKCTGRDFTLDTREGILATDGHIKWETEKHTERLAIETYNNAICKKCKLLPLCYGPCSQKYIEMRKSGKTIEDLCQLKMSEMSVDEYIMLRLRSVLNIAKL